MPQDETSPKTLASHLGRTLFGRQAQAYEDARPPYPGLVFEMLAQAAGLQPGMQGFEIGPGTGLASLPLLAKGVSLDLIEPDLALATQLQPKLKHGPSRSWHLVPSPFEDAALPQNHYTFGCAATVMHWLKDQAVLAKIHALLKPKGVWAMWWNVFGDPRTPDAFQQLSEPLFARLPLSPSRGEHPRLPYALDSEARIAELKTAGFAQVSYTEIRWQHRMNKNQMLALTASFSPVLALSDSERQAFLHDLGLLIEHQGGMVLRDFVTPLYLAHKA